jgi:Na+/H+-translocating membrane pyrophosphatase
MHAHEYIVMSTVTTAMMMMMMVMMMMTTMTSMMMSVLESRAHSLGMHVQAKAKVRDEFKKNKSLSDPRVVSILVLKGTRSVVR